MVDQVQATAFDRSPKRICISHHKWKPSPPRSSGTLDKRSSDAEEGGIGGDGQDVMEVDQAPSIDLSAFEQPLRPRGGYGEDSAEAQLQAEMGAALSKEAQADIPIHELINNTLRSTSGKPTAQEHAQQSVAEIGAQHTETTSATKKKPAPSSRANGQLRRPKHVCENLSYAQRPKAGTRSNDTYEIPPTPKKSNKANNARLPAKFAKEKAALMPGVGVADDLDVDMNKDEPEVSQVAVERSAEHKIEQEAPARKVTRITPKGTAKRIAQGQKTQNNDSFTFTRLAKPDGQQTRPQSDGRNLRSRGDVVELERVDWDRKPEVVAREKRKNASSTAERRFSEELTPPTGLSSTGRNTGKAMGTRNESNAEVEQVPSPDAYKDQVGTIDHTAGTQDEPAASEGAGHMGSDGDETDETNKDVPTSAQRQNNDDTSPAREQESREQDHDRSDEQSRTQQLKNDEESIFEEDEEQAVDVDEDGSATNDISDAESEASVSSLDMAGEGLFGQANNLVLVREAIESVGIQTKKDRTIQHKIKLKTRIIKKIVGLVEEAKELRAELEEVGEEDRQSLAKGFREQLTKIKEEVGFVSEVNAGTKQQQMIEEIYAHGIPKLALLLMVLIRYHQENPEVDDYLLRADVTLLRAIKQLGDTASRWEKRPDPELTIVRPIRNGVLPPLELVRSAFQRELRRRKEEKSRQQHDANLLQIELKREEEEQLREEQYHIDLEASRARRKQAIEEVFRKTDPIARYHEKRDQTSSSRASSLNAAFVRQPTPDGAHAWTKDENLTLIEGLQRFTDHDRYQKIEYAYGGGRVPLADRSLGTSNGIRNRRLAKRSQAEMIERAKELKSLYEAYAEKYPEVGPLADWMESI